MAGDHAFTDWNDLRVQRHWYKLRDELNAEIQSATDELRRDFDISVKLNSATIAGDGDRSVLRVPVSATWRHELEQTIAYVLVTSVAEDEPRLSAVAHGVEEALKRWIEREVPVAAAPVFLYPESEVRWPELDASQGKTETTTVAARPPAAPAAAAPAPATSAAAPLVPTSAPAAPASEARPAQEAVPASDAPREQPAPVAPAPQPPAEAPAP